MIGHAWNSRFTKSRRGTSLVEVIVTMTIASSLLLMATAWIHQSFSLSSKMRENGRHHDQLMRLSRQFRDDVHQADSVESTSETTLALVSGELRIEYAIDGADVTRIERGLDDNLPPSRERFRFRDGSRLSWTRPEDSWVTLLMKRPVTQPDSGLPRPSDLHVRARVGRLRKKPS